MVLRLDGWVCQEVQDGREAMSSALANPPTVAVLDAHLAGVACEPLCLIIRLDRSTREVPIVVLGPANRERLADACDAVLDLPCMPDVLLETVTRLSSRGTVRQTLTPTRHPKTHRRPATDVPGLPPPDVVCPSCDAALMYDESYLGGVNGGNAEQWDYYECPRGCGRFQFRQRTRKLKMLRQLSRRH
jgi:hypothetical protein